MQTASPVAICSRRSPAAAAGAAGAGHRRHGAATAIRSGMRYAACPQRCCSGRDEWTSRRSRGAWWRSWELPAATWMRAARRLRPAALRRERSVAGNVQAECKLTVIDEVHRGTPRVAQPAAQEHRPALRAGDRGGCFVHGGVGSRDQTTSNRPLSVARGFRAGGEVLRPGRRCLVHGGEETPSGHRGLVDQEMRVARHSRPLPDHDHGACAERRNCCSAVSSAVRPCEHAFGSAFQG